MRQRKNKDLDKKIEDLSSYVTDTENRGRWREVFSCIKGEDAGLYEKDSHSLYAEIGCGKGRFITTLAERAQGDLFVGIEGHESVILRSLEKADEKELDNILFICGYMHDIHDIFADNELDGIYLNFSDPWPKARHAKRRLTHRKFLSSYMDVIRTGGFIQFKTDNDGLFDFTLEEIRECGYEISQISYDLHSSDLEAKNIMTEYEERFLRLKTPIKYVKIKVK